jgi:broad specificity phosphatase PhoE
LLQIIITRHGETDWNVQKIFRGHADIDLNLTGRKQAELLAQYLKDTKLDAIYSSPLERALRTAQIVAGQQHRLRMETDLDLVDFDYGEWQGVSEEDVKKKYAELYDRWQKEPFRVKMPGGESLNEVKKRVQRALNQITSEYESGTVLIVSHRIVMKVLILNLLGLDTSHMGNIKLDACGLTVFNYEKDTNRFIMTRFNETCFLNSLKKSPAEDF